MNICLSCIGKNRLKHLLPKRTKEHCFLCNQRKNCIDSNLFFSNILEVIKSNFIFLDDLTDFDRCTIVECGSNQFYTTDIHNLLSDEELNDKISDLFLEWLESQSEKDIINKILVFNDGELETYNKFIDTWDNLITEIKHFKRFLNSNIINFFDELFSYLDIEETILTLDENCILYRARNFKNQKELEEIKKNPAVELGTVSHLKASNQRMTPFGIAAFYGSFDIPTCINEIRPIVGSFLVTGKFKPIKSLNAIDWTSINIKNKFAFFDKKHSLYCQALACIKGIIFETSKPSISNKDLDYLPSQFFFEYLRENYSKKVHGIIFPSVQTNKKGRNIILFPEKSRIISEVDTTDSTPTLCIEHHFYEEHIAFIPGSLQMHKIKNIITEFDTTPIDKKFLCFNEKLMHRLFKNW